jgi:predicted GTPase
MLEEKAKRALENLQRQLEKAQNRNLTFLLVGRTGVGKSSTVNSLIGQEIAQVGHYEATTMEIKEYNSEINNIPFKVIDTPGLCDELEELENDYKYLEMMRSQVKQIDCMWFVSKLDETRVTTDEKRGIKLISEAFGSDVWKHAVIVFTFANSVPDFRYLEALEKRTELIRQVIAKYASPDIATNIPSVAVDNKSESTPNGEKWLGELYTKIFTQISQKATATFLLATADFIRPKRIEEKFSKNSTSQTREPQPYRFSFNNGFSKESKQENNNTSQNTSDHHYSNQQRYNNTSQNVSNDYKYQKYTRPRIELNERQKVEIRKTINANVVPQYAAVGAAIGFVGGGVGAAIGGAIGAALGAIAWLWNR